MEEIYSYLFFATILLFTIAFYLWLHKRAEYRSRAALAKAAEVGLTEPASLHPVIDPNTSTAIGEVRWPEDEDSGRELLEHARVFDNYYGTSAASVRHELEREYDPLRAVSPVAVS